MVQAESQVMSEDLSMKDLWDGDPSNGIVIKFLDHKAQSRSCGVAYARNILWFAQKSGIDIPAPRSPLIWINFRVQDAICISQQDSTSPYVLEEIQGFGRGINFRWWKREK